MSILKWGCISLAVAVPILLIVGGIVAYRALDSSLGVSLAPPVAHETLAQPETRLRLAVYPDRATDFLLGLLPPDFSIPRVPVSNADAFATVLPYEVAVLGGMDYGQGEFGFTVFVNERRFGPFVREQGNLARVFDEIRQINWDTEGIQLNERGTLTLSGGLPLPDDAEERITERWDVSTAPSNLLISGEHLVEFALDNKDGDLMALVYGILQAVGEDPAVLFEPIEPINLRPEILIVESASIAGFADITGDDEITATVRLTLHPAETRQTEFIVTLGYGALFDQLADAVADIGLEIKHKDDEFPRWEGDDFEPTYVITGFREQLVTRIAEVLAEAEATS